MALTFKEVAKKTLELPGIGLSKLSDFIFGYKRLEQPDGASKSVGPEITCVSAQNEEEIALEPAGAEVNKKSGLVGLIASGIKWAGRGISAFMHHNKMGAGIWFWSSLLLAGAAALTLFLWPAALATVASISVFGFSIGAIAGASVLAQIGLSAAVVATAVTAANIVAGTVKGIVNSIIGCVRSFKNVPAPHVAGPSAHVTSSHRRIGETLGTKADSYLPTDVHRTTYTDRSIGVFVSDTSNNNNNNNATPDAVESVSSSPSNK